IQFLFFFGGVVVCFGRLAILSNPSLYYGVVGLVLAPVAGCKWLLSLGLSFVLLMLFMGFLGGMFLISVYSVSLVADPF
ncbi:NU6M oxidoreductase, partial [Onychorhynchus coronatus]|nr:NU6M oxidoreductase [Onychorhynchus coronatus]